MKNMLMCFMIIMFFAAISCNNDNSKETKTEEEKQNGNMYDNHDITPPIVRDSLVDSLQAR